MELPPPLLDEPAREHIKLSLEYCRHLTALSAGAIVLQVGFLERLFPHPRFKALVAISILAFTGTILASLLAQWFLLRFVGADSPLEAQRDGNIAGGATAFMWVCFSVGLLTAVLFALINLFLT